MSSGCSVCGALLKARGLCARHYLRLLRYGRADVVVRGEVPPVLRFLRFVESGPLWKGTHCWLWKGAKTRDGYGHFHLNGKMVRAHRFAFEHLGHGTFPLRHDWDHLCRRHDCVNWLHGQPVTRPENSKREAIARRKERAA